jgi:hypothetical protein
MSDQASRRAREGALDAASIRAVRTGHGANCSSIGSVIDTLFATAAVGTAVFAAVVAALQREDVKVAGGGDSPPPPLAPARAPSPAEPPASEGA